MYAPVVTTGVPSAALNVNAAPPAATWLCGGDETVGVDEVGSPGATTLIAYARAVAPAPPAGDCAPAAPAPRSASESAKAIRSRRANRLHSMEDAARSRRLRRAQLPFRERAKPLARVRVRPDRLLLRVVRVGSDLLGHAPDLLRERVPVLRIVEERVHPRLRAVVGREIVVEEGL